LAFSFSKIAIGLIYQLQKTKISKSYGCFFSKKLFLIAQTPRFLVVKKKLIIMKKVYPIWPLQVDTFVLQLSSTLWTSISLGLAT
jgi:hypothetical protein